jgi:hypothetical protein
MAQAILSCCICAQMMLQRTGFVVFGQLLGRLHDNGSRNYIRAQVARRKVSGGTRSGAVRDCRAAFLGLAKTCARLGSASGPVLGPGPAPQDRPQAYACPTSSGPAVSLSDRSGIGPYLRCGYLIEPARESGS